MQDQDTDRCSLLWREVPEPQRMTRALAEAIARTWQTKPGRIEEFSQYLLNDPPRHSDGGCPAADEWYSTPGLYRPCGNKVTAHGVCARHWRKPEGPLRPLSPRTMKDILSRFSLTPAEAPTPSGDQRRKEKDNQRGKVRASSRIVATWDNWHAEEYMMAVLRGMIEQLENVRAAELVRIDGEIRRLTLLRESVAV